MAQRGSDMTAQISSLTKFVDKMNKQSICNADCQRKKNLEKKKNAYINAKNNLRNAPAQLENAEKEYMVLDKGENYYASYIEKKYENEGKNIIRNYLDQHVNPVYNDIQNKLDYYKSQDSYRNNVDYLYETYNNDLKKLRKESKKTRSEKNVKDRLGYFYNNTTENINSINYYLKIMYWIFVAIIVVLVIFKQNYRKYEYWPFLIMILSFPFLLTKMYTVIMNNTSHFFIENIYIISIGVVGMFIALFSVLSALPFKKAPE